MLSLPSQNFLAGGLAASAFWLVSLPGSQFTSLPAASADSALGPSQSADNTKNRMMTDRLSTPRYSSVLAAVRAIYVEGGVLGFWRGFAPVALRAFPMNASALMVYESVMRMAGTDKVCASLLLKSRPRVDTPALVCTSRREDELDFYLSATG